MKKTRIRCERGQGMTEYIVLVALVAIAAIAVVGFFGDVVRNQFYNKPVLQHDRGAGGKFRSQ